MKPVEHFKHCPRCGVPRAGEAVAPFICAACGFVFYFNPTVAAAVIIERADGGVLFITRAKEPAKGKLAFPGGFIDFGERVEDGLRREVREEVGLEIGGLNFLCSLPNDYLYREVAYPVVDLIFTSCCADDQSAAALDGVARCDWLEPRSVTLADLAFPSLRAGLADFLRRKLQPAGPVPPLPAAF